MAKEDPRRSRDAAGIGPYAWERERLIPLGDMRGWKRLLWWRDQLERGQQPTDVRDIYKRALRFTRQAPTEVDLQAAHEYALAENC